MTLANNLSIWEVEVGGWRVEISLGHILSQQIKSKLKEENMTGSLDPLLAKQNLSGLGSRCCCYCF